MNRVKLQTVDITLTPKVSQYLTKLKYCDINTMTHHNNAIPYTSNPSTYVHTFT